ncbi:hypothetical protein PIB30_101416, partial [Stylosanthes scabra]|nr:hypothetical protein [Stylosanthes scabra]
VRTEDGGWVGISCVGGGRDPAGYAWGVGLGEMWVGAECKCGGGWGVRKVGVGVGLLEVSVCVKTEERWSSKVEE